MFSHPLEGKRKQMQLILNDQSSRKTENAIGFRGEERLFGSFAINNMKFSPATSYTYLRDLLGVRSVEEAKERVGPYVSYADHLFETDGDYKLIGITNPVTGNNFTVIELVGMIFQHAVRTAETDTYARLDDFYFLFLAINSLFGMCL
jgi:molecular chaperone DnaK (HSP70)